MDKINVTRNDWLDYMLIYESRGAKYPPDVEEWQQHWEGKWDKFYKFIELKNDAKLSLIEKIAKSVKLALQNLLCYFERK